MPLIEIYVLIQVGQVIGPWWTILLLILDSLFGTWLIRREGGRAWQALRVALESGRMPARELADGALILVGGTLMLTPGFVTDAFGILLILPVHPAGRPEAADPGRDPATAGRRKRLAPDPVLVDRSSGARWSRSRAAGQPAFFFRADARCR